MRHVNVRQPQLWALPVTNVANRQSKLSYHFSNWQRFKSAEKSARIESFCGLFSNLLNVPHDFVRLQIVQRSGTYSHF